MPPDFEAALLSLRGHAWRSEVRLEEVPPPTRIAPWALALTAEVNPTSEPEDMVANGRFVVLHDPDGQDAWNGTFRVVVLARARLEDEMGDDPLLGEAAWSWLTDSLTEAGADYHSLSGTVTRVLSETFGGLEVRGHEVEVELRASWTPGSTDLGPHLRAWVAATAWAGGLPPLPENVTALGARRPRG
ncbi:MAG: enoyl-CoA hydratase [Micrococcales bacterium 73-15]|nr:MAG: enoyl-CoA hydratase [Micrococcales bacterium 73-15]